MPHDIALTSTDPAYFDAHLLAQRQEADIDLHFVHHVPGAGTRDGQAAAALLEALIDGLSQRGLRRPARLCANAPLFSRTARTLAAGAAGGRRAGHAAGMVASAGAHVPADWPKGPTTSTPPATLTALLHSLQQGATAEQAGDQLLRRRALSNWRQSLATGAIAAGHHRGYEAGPRV